MATVLGSDIERAGSDGEDRGLGAGARELKREKWFKWLNSKFYGEVTRAKLDGLQAKEEMDMGRNEWRSLMNKARRYVMVEGRDGKLIWREKDGQLALCVLEEEVGKVLRRLHDGHGHFAAGITEGRAHGKYYWPSRQKDIGRWIASCEPCQRMTKMQRCGQMRSVLQFSPMDMVGMDFIGPINPPCEATGATYILLVVDYFSRFVFGAALGKADQQSTMRFFVDKVVPIVGWPKSVYTDNGSHFTGSAIRKMWEDHRVMQFTAAISHPQSVGLSERYVQMTMGRIRMSCIEMGSSKNWGLLVKDALININTRCVRVHGYTPSEILLGFNPVTTRAIIIEGEALETDLAIDSNEEIPELEETSVQVHIDGREERHTAAVEKLSRSQDNRQVKASRGYRSPRVGDLVLVRDIQLSKEKGKKLEPRWSTPRVLEKILKSGVSGHVRHLHDPPGKTKRFHFDDLVPFVSRSDDFPSAGTVSPAVEYTRDALSGSQTGWTSGQRAFDLSDLR